MDKANNIDPQDIAHVTASNMTHRTVRPILNDPLAPPQSDEVRQKAVRSCWVNLWVVKSLQVRPPSQIYWERTRTIIVAAFTSESPSSLGTFNS